LVRAEASGRLDNKGGLSPTTVRHHYAVLREALNHAVRLQLIATNPAKAVQPPRYTRKETNVLTEAQTAQLLKAAEGTELYAPLVVATCTGLRRQEFLGLKRADVNLETGTLAVRRALQITKAGLKFKEPKSAQSKRTIALPAFAVEVLKEHLERQEDHKRELGSLYQDQDLVFPRDDGRPWDPSRFSTQFREFEHALDLPRIRLHDLRHGHCSQILRQGTPLKMASARMGHSTIAITADLYGHILEGQDRAAADLFNIALSEAFQEVASRR
jgi:integrase